MCVCVCGVVCVCVCVLSHFGFKMNVAILLAGLRALAACTWPPWYHVARAARRVPRPHCYSLPRLVRPQFLLWHLIPRLQFCRPQVGSVLHRSQVRRQWGRRTILDNRVRPRVASFRLLPVHPSNGGRKQFKPSPPKPLPMQWDASSTKHPTSPTWPISGRCRRPCPRPVRAKACGAFLVLKQVEKRLRNLP